MAVHEVSVKDVSTSKEDQGNRNFRVPHPDTANKPKKKKVVRSTHKPAAPESLQRLADYFNSRKH